MISCSSLKAIQAIPKGSDLSAVLALMPIVHVDKDIIQGILYAIPGKCSNLAEHFWTNPLSQRHHLRVCIIELVQHLSHCSPFASLHLGIVKLATQLGKLVQVGCRVPAAKPRHYIYQHLFIGTNFGTAFLDCPITTASLLFPTRFQN